MYFNQSRSRSRKSGCQNAETRITRPKMIIPMSASLTNFETPSLRLTVVLGKNTLLKAKKIPLCLAEQ